MAHRTIQDRSGREWQVWDTYPDQFRPLTKDAASEDMLAGMARVPITVPTELAGGWLVFLSGADRRRLAPIPPGWDAMPAHELANFIERAVRVTPGSVGGVA
jgi:hypothetical protein